MRSLLHTPLDPASRMIRIMLAEKGLPARLVNAPPEDEGGDLVANNPAGAIPVLIDEAPSGEDVSIAPAAAIAEYLDEVYKAPPLLPATAAGRAEARRLAAWFFETYERDVNAATLRRYAPRDHREQTPTDYNARAVADALAWHLDYISWLAETRPWLAGESYTIADIAAAAYLSASDYLSLISWADFPHVKDWYQRIKSRPAFQPILKDRLDHITPPDHYDDLDF